MQGARRPRMPFAPIPSSSLPPILDYGPNGRVIDTADRTAGVNFSVFGAWFVRLLAHTPVARIVSRLDWAGSPRTFAVFFARPPHQYVVSLPRCSLL